QYATTTIREKRNGAVESPRAAVKQWLIPVCGNPSPRVTVPRDEAVSGTAVPEPSRGARGGQWHCPQPVIVRSGAVVPDRTIVRARDRHRVGRGGGLAMVGTLRGRLRFPV